MKDDKPRRGRRLIIAGAALVAAALLLTAWNLYDQYRAGNAANAVLGELLPEPVAPTPGAGGQPEPDETPAATPEPTPHPEEMPTQTIDGYDYIGVLSVPSLGLELPVMSEWDYTRLRIAPCRYSGTAWESGFVIAAHNYNSHFGQMHSLEPGAEVIFTAVDDSVFSYEVAEVLILQPTAVEEMLDPSWDLSLFTCTIGGATRVTVRCVRV